MSKHDNPVLCSQVTPENILSSADTRTADSSEHEMFPELRQAASSVKVCVQLANMSIKDIHHQVII